MASGQLVAGLQGPARPRKRPLVPGGISLGASLATWRKSSRALSSRVLARRSRCLGSIRASRPLRYSSRAARSRAESATGVFGVSLGDLELGLGGPRRDQVDPCLAVGRGRPGSGRPGALATARSATAAPASEEPEPRPLVHPALQPPGHHRHVFIGMMNDGRRCVVEFVDGEGLVFHRSIRKVVPCPPTFADPAASPRRGTTKRAS